MSDPSYISIPLRYCTGGGAYKSHAENSGNHKLLVSKMRAALYKRAARTRLARDRPAGDGPG